MTLNATLPHSRRRNAFISYTPPIIPPGTRAEELMRRPVQTGDPELTIVFKVRASKAPALRSAVEELSQIIGSRLEGSHKFAKEHALTDAAIGVGSLRAAVNAQVAAGDPNYV